MAVRAGTAYIDIEPDMAGLHKQLNTAMSRGRLSKLGIVGGAAIGYGLARGARAAWMGTVGAAAQFETAFSEVRKTVDTNAQGFARLERGIRRMARAIPVSADELSNLAGQAGALGIRSKDLLRFTRTASELGIATDLSSEEAANALARLTNIMGTAPRYFRRLGSTLVRLGNEGASTEQEIAAMALRIAGAGEQIGLSEAQVLSYASALSSVGVDAEAGGSAISRVFIRLATAARQGGRDLATVATVAGMSGAQFRTAFEKNAARATLAFITGLDRLKRSGGDVFGTLDKLRLSEIRVRDALLRASAAGRLFKDQLATGNDEWRTNTALTREANERYKTSAARYQRLRNQVRDFGISIGQDVLPRLNELMDIVTDDRLGGREKFEALSRALSELVADGLSIAVENAAEAGPRIAKALASGIVNAWGELNPLGKALTAAAIIRAVGGRGALLKSGATVGGLLGAGMSSGMAASAGIGGVGAAGAGLGGAALASVGYGAGRGGKLVYGRQFRSGAPVSQLGSRQTIGGRALSAVGAAAPFLGRLGAVGLGVFLADRVLGEFSARVRERSPDFAESLRGSLGKQFGGEDLSGRLHMAGVVALLDRLRERRVAINTEGLKFLEQGRASVDLTEQQARSYDHLLNLIRRSRALRIRVDAGVDPGALSRISNNLSFLRAGWGASMRDILKVSRRNMTLIRSTIGENTADGRKLAAENMRATAAAIRQQMERSGNVTRSGMARVRDLIRNANLIDPSRRQAEAFGRQWAAGMDRTKEITRRGIRQMLAEAQQMPGPMRKIALDVWMAQLEAARKSRRITADEFRRMRSTVAAEFTGMRGASRDAASSIPGNVAAMVSRATDGLSILASNVNKTLGAFGARALRFDLKKVDGQRRQRGGFIVPGHGSGDTVPGIFPVGTGIINRKAARALLEPGEIGLLPGEVDRIGGPNAIHAINRAIPRFQTGGIVGGIPDAMGALPGLDALAMVLAQRFGLHVSSGLRPGAITTTGNPSDHGWGGAIDVTNGVTTPQMDAAYAFLTGTAIAKAIKQILYRTMVGGDHYNHIHVALQPAFATDAAAVLSLLGAGDLPRLLLDGPSGALREMGQGALDSARTAGTDAIQRALASMGTLTGPGGSDAYVAGGNGADLMQQIASQRGWSFADWWTLDGRETGHGADIFNEASDAFNRAQFLPMNRGKYGPGSLPGASMIEQIYSMAEYIADRYGNPSAALAWHDDHGWYRRGGIIEMLQGGGVLGTAARARRRGNRPTIARRIGDALRVARRRGVPRPRRTRAVKRALRIIGDIGLSQGRQRRLFTLSQDAEKANELALRAADLSYELLYAERTPALNPDGSPVLGPDGKPTFHAAGDPILDADRRPMKHWELVNGFSAPDWVTKQLDALFSLRNRLIEAETIVSREQQRIARLIERTRERLERVQRQIARTVERRRSLDGQLRTAERQLERAQEHPRRNRAQIASLKDRITDLREKLRINEVDQRLGVREREAIRHILGAEGEGGLLGKRGSLRELRGNLLGDGDSFKGLRTVQGFGPMTLMGTLPEMGVLGGEIFDAQKAFKDLTTLPASVELDAGDIGAAGGDGGAADDSERMGLLEDLLRQSQQRELIANQQFAVLRDLPPFGGSFATGGVVPGPPGAARTIIAHGGEMITPLDAPATNVRVVIQDQRTRVFIDEREVRAIVRDETRQMVRGARFSGRAGVLQ